jgi:hypothetical protein
VNASSANVGISFGAVVTEDALDREELGAAEETMLGGSFSGVGVALLPQATEDAAETNRKSESAVVLVN